MSELNFSYLLNTNTGEIHDTDKIVPSCNIETDKTENFKSFETYDEAVKYCEDNDIKDPDGCGHCLKEKNTDSVSIKFSNY